MIEDEVPQGHDTPGRDHNQPPGLLPLEHAIADWKEFLRERPIGNDGKTFDQRKAEIIRSAKRAIIRSRADVGAAGDLIKIAGKVWKRLEDARMERSQPYRDTADALTRSADAYWDDVRDALADVHENIKTWTDAEDKLIAQQREERDREMQRMIDAARPAPEPEPAAAPAQRELLDYRAPAPQPAPEPAASLAPKKRKIRGDLGAIVSTVEKDILTVTDVRALPDYVLNAPAVHAAIIAVVRQTKKTLGVPTGIAVTTDQVNQVR